MFLNDRTLEELGYTVEEVKTKNVYVKCDYCGKEWQKKKDVIIKSRVKLNKDACGDCCYIKRKEIEEVVYGGISPNQRPETKEKIKQSIKNKYGCESYTQTKEFKEKAKKTKIEKYGTEHVMQNKDHKNKVKKIMIDKYGHSNALQNKKILEKQKQTCLEKFGYSNAMKNIEIQKKQQESCVEKFGVDNVFKLQEYQDQAYQTRINNGNIKKFEGKLIKEWAKENGYSYSHFCYLIQNYGFEEASQMIRISKGMTSLELLVSNWLDEIKIEYKKQFRVENRIADFYLPDHNLIIECNGNFWHSDQINKDKYYHKNKKELYTKHGYESLFFREDEIQNKFDIVKSIILNKCHKSKRIFARKCIMEEISKEEGKKFLKENHLMGSGAGRCFALKHEGEIVSIARIKNTSKGIELNRFAHKKGITVVGGLSKLLSIFPSIYTFIDLRYGSGEYLKDLGFKQEKTYLSFKWTNGEKVYNRMNYPSNLGYNIGLAKIWDCGQAKFIK